MPDYIAGRNSTFAYMLEGIDSDWQHTTTSRTASYARVPHGKYRFLVKAANNDGKWSAGPSVLYIKVLPVWYDTIFAKLMFFLVAAALIMAGFHIYVGAARAWRQGLRWTERTGNTRRNCTR